MTNKRGCHFWSSAGTTQNITFGVSARTDSEDNLAFIADLRLGRSLQTAYLPYLRDMKAVRNS